jgi:hypothetical protein
MWASKAARSTNSYASAGSLLRRGLVVHDRLSHSPDSRRHRADAMEPFPTPEGPAMT